MVCQKFQLLKEYILYLYKDRDVLRLHVARSGNLFVLNRARRGQLERCRRVVVVVAPARVGRQDSVAPMNRGLPANGV